MIESKSWVIIRKKTNEILFETFNKSLADKVNTKAYNVVPIYEYLCSLNNS